MTFGDCQSYSRTLAGEVGLFWQQLTAERESKRRKSSFCCSENKEKGAGSPKSPHPVFCPQAGLALTQPQVGSSRVGAAWASSVLGQKGYRHILRPQPGPFPADWALLDLARGQTQQQGSANISRLCQKWY